MVGAAQPGGCVVAQLQAQRRVQQRPQLAHVPELAVVRGLEGVCAHEGGARRAQRGAARLARVRPREDARAGHAERAEQRAHVRARRAASAVRPEVGCDGAVAPRGGVVAARRARVEQQRGRRVGPQPRPQEGERGQRVVQNMVEAGAVLVARQHDVLAARLHLAHAARLQRRRHAPGGAVVARRVEHDLRCARHPHLPRLADLWAPHAQSRHAAATSSLELLRRVVPREPAAPKAAVGHRCALRRPGRVQLQRPTGLSQSALRHRRQHERARPTPSAAPGVHRHAAVGPSARARRQQPDGQLRPPLHIFRFPPSWHSLKHGAVCDILGVH